MKKRDRFQAFANFMPVDRVPRKASYVKDMDTTMTRKLGRPPEQYFDMDEGVMIGLTPPDDFSFPDYSVFFPEHEDGKDGFSIDANGCGHLNHGFHHFTEYLSPLRQANSLSEIEKYPLADNSNWSDAKMDAVCKESKETGEFYTTAFVGHIYETAWQIRGYEEFLMDLMTQTDWAECLLDRIAESRMKIAVAGAKAKCDCIHTGDDVANQNAMMFQPEIWRKIFKPRWAKIYAAVCEIKPDMQIWYHSDGNILPIVDDLIEIGVTILNPVQPECIDPVALRKRYGKRLAFDGCIGTQTTFPFGTETEMQQTVSKLAKSLDALKGGLMLSPTHQLEPEVPPENVIAFFTACDKLCTP